MQLVSNQRIGKHAYNNRSTVGNGVLYSVVVKNNSVENLQSSSRVPSEQLVESWAPQRRLRRWRYEFSWLFSCQQFSRVKRREVAGWWMREFSWELKVRQWRDDFACAVVQRYLEWDCYNACVKIRCQETANGDCNGLRTQVCVCEWSVNCSSEWCIQVVNKSNIQSIPHL
jgi:hypothetical protein